MWISTVGLSHTQFFCRLHVVATNTANPVNPDFSHSRPWRREAIVNQCEINYSQDDRSPDYWHCTAEPKWNNL
jgi:flagellar basal body rod protein FlgC